MGIYNVVGYTEPNSKGIRFSFPANTKTEMMQEIIKAKKFDGKEVTLWQAQTAKGKAVLGGTSIELTENINFPVLVDCPICRGQGRKNLGKSKNGLPMIRVCPICRGSGKCRKNHWKKWRNWQLESIRKDFE